MSSLQIVRGANQGQSVPLTDEKPVILGRNPDCGVVIPISSVSREHARITFVNGRFHIEDLASRNGTYINNQAVTERTALRHNDRIRICDFIATYIDEDDSDSENDDSSSTTVEATLMHNSTFLLQQQPAEKLRGLLDIGANLSKTLDLEELWPAIVESLFHLFLQADRCFIIESDDGGKTLKPRFVRTRREADEQNARFSRGIVRQCLETSQAFLSDDASQDNRVQLNQSVIDFRIRSVMCVPLCNAEGKAFGVIQLDTQDRAKKFTKEDLDLLQGVANQAAISLENARLVEAEVDLAKYEKAMETAKAVQLSFLPDTNNLPEVTGYETAAYYHAAQAVGGDYFDFITTPDGQVVMALGDVAGKGIPAALLSAKLSSDARFSFVTKDDPAEAIAMLNDLLAEHCGRTDKFVTLAAAVVNIETHEVTLVNGGHMSPLLFRRATGKFEECVTRAATGLPLGMLAGMPFDATKLTLEPGDVIFIYSDGVTDATNKAGEQFEMSGVTKALAEKKECTAKEVVRYMLEKITVHSAGVADQADDITMTAIGRLP